MISCSLLLHICIALVPLRDVACKRYANLFGAEPGYVLGTNRKGSGAKTELKADGVLPVQTLVQTNKRLNNLIEQDHRKVKQRCYPTLGFETFGNALVTLLTEANPSLGWANTAPQ